MLYCLAYVLKTLKVFLKIFRRNNWFHFEAKQSKRKKFLTIRLTIIIFIIGKILASFVSMRKRFRNMQLKLNVWVQKYENAFKYFLTICE